MSPELRKHWFGETADEGLEIWPENWLAIQLFCFCATQWNYLETGARTGLNYAAVQAVFTMQQIPARLHGRLMSDIRLIELGALGALAKKAEKSHGA
jgi:hypothetical protein